MPFRSGLILVGYDVGRRKAGMLGPEVLVLPAFLDG